MERASLRRSSRGRRSPVASLGLGLNLGADCGRDERIARHLRNSRASILSARPSALRHSTIVSLGWVLRRAAITPTRFCASGRVRFGRRALRGMSGLSLGGLWWAIVFLLGVGECNGGGRARVLAQKRPGANVDDLDSGAGPAPAALDERA